MNDVQIDPFEKRLNGIIKVFMMTLAVLVGAGLAVIELAFWLFGPDIYFNYDSFPHWLGQGAIFAILAYGPFAKIMDKKSGK